VTRAPSSPPKTTLWRGRDGGSLAVALADHSQRLIWRAPSLPGQGVSCTCTEADSITQGVVQECLLMRDGVHVVLHNGAMMHLYFNGLSPAEYTQIILALRDVCAVTPGILEVLNP
jgi:hypothetical protein